MEIFLIRALQLLLALSILIVLHEGGHFFFAKLFGVRVEKFYLFFDWKFSLFKYKPKNSDTEYGIGWIPLGGYCKIAGMIDESFDTEQMQQPEQPWEFRTKPAWQRLLIMVGGVLVNFILALVIYSAILFHWGDTYIPLKDMTYGMKFNEEAQAYGFRDGDILIGTEKGEFKDFSVDLYRDLSSATRVDIVRDGKPASVALPGNLNMLGMLKADPSFVRPLIPAVVDSIMAGSPAEKTGLAKGDTITMLCGREVNSYNAFMDIIARRNDMLATAQTAADSLKARSVTMAFSHEGNIDTTDVVLTADMKVGFAWRYSAINALYTPYTHEYGLLESIPAGVSYGLNVLGGYIGDMKYVFTSDGAKSLGGFGAIGSLFPPVWDWYMFWRMTALLSIILAFMNILPIPALDGGHVLFLIYEMITRRKPSEQFMVRAEYIGFGLVLLLMIVANLNDVLRLLGYM